MKQVICCLLLCLLAGYRTTAQHNIFFKKDKPKHDFTAKKPAPVINKQQPVAVRISSYSVSEAVNRPFNFYMPKEYVSASSKDDILYILGLAGSIFSSIYSDKMHYNYPYSPVYSPVNYWKTPH
jgi:hypothetical protein